MFWLCQGECCQKVSCGEQCAFVMMWIVGVPGASRDHNLPGGVCMWIPEVCVATPSCPRVPHYPLMPGFCSLDYVDVR
jgi:hypothetical protein